MSVPADLREQLRSKLWHEADEVGWMLLSTGAKSRHYDNWARDPDVGGLLARYMDRSQLRIYLKDTLLKGYGNAKLADERRPLRVLRVSEDIQLMERFRKPHGCRLADGRLVCWGKASEWKMVLMALHERCFGTDRAPRGAVFFNALGTYREPGTRQMVEDAATRLGIEDVAWLES